MKILNKLTVAAALFGTALFADLNVAVTNIPQKVFVEKIGGENVNVDLLVPPGSNPHSYTPKPQQMKEMSKADIYFTIGIEFEKAWVPKFKALNKNMHVKSMQEGMDLIEFKDEHDDHEKHHDQQNHHEHSHEGIDPHVWTSPAAVKIMGKNILHELKELDPKNSAYYEKNYKSFLKYVEETDHKIKNILKDVPKGTKFMVFHPAFGYFAHQYGLKQVPIEVEGKEPKPKMLAYIIEEAKHDGIKTIITSPEFSDKAAKTLAKEIGGSVIKISPLNPKWSENLIKLAKSITEDHEYADHDEHNHKGHHH
jgi:zinc transport system substrate-binding protein